MKNFTFYWLDGTREVLEGETSADALNRSGYGAGALPALDFVCNGEDNGYTWNGNQWVKNTILHNKYIILLEYNIN